MKKRSYACLSLLALTALVACNSGYQEASKEQFLEVVEKDSKKEITYKSAKTVSTLKKFDVKVPEDILAATNMTQEQFNNKMLNQMQLELNKPIEEIMKGEDLADLRFTVEDASVAPEGTKYYISGDNFKVETTKEENGMTGKLIGEFNEYGYCTYTYTDMNMKNSSLGFEMSISMATEMIVSYSE